MQTMQTQEENKVVMQTTKDREHVKDLVNNATNVAIVCNAQNGNDTDTVAAGIAFAKFLKSESQVRADVIYPGNLENINSELFDLCPIKNSLQPKVLKITVDYAGTDIDSFSYDSEAESKLQIELKPVSKDFDMNRISYDFEGIEYDLIIVIGASSLENLGEIYQQNKEEFNNAIIINIDNSSKNESFGRINIVDTSAESISQLLFNKFAHWEYAPNGSAATALLTGLRN